MLLSPGERLGPYEVLSLIGEGGMGEVYKAHDTRLNRSVAIKVSKATFDERFEREARTVAALNHPNICTLHDVGPNYLVMELLEGQTLADRLRRGSLPVEQALGYGAAIGDALAEAHSRGIIHRDLKPGNIMLTKAGLKVLDFGLAKTLGEETLTASYGMVVGTPAYMAPEQRLGAGCDIRTDIYAMGLVLYEMATGKRLAAGEAAVIERLPARLGHIMERCLAGDPNNRWQSAADVAAELRWAATDSRPATALVSRKPLLAWLAALSVILGLTAGVTFALRGIHVDEPKPVTFTLSLASPLLNDDEVPEVSPDGRYSAASLTDGTGKRRMWVRPLDKAAGRWLDGTEDAGSPFWSPDSHWIGYIVKGRIRKVSPEGGPPQTLAEVQSAFDPAWNGQGDIVLGLSNRSPLYRIRESGGAPEPITSLDAARTENSHRHARFLADGRHFIFTARCTSAENNALYLGSLDSKETRRLGTIDSQAIPVPGGLLYAEEGTLLRRAFDGERFTGPPATVAAGVFHSRIAAHAAFSVSIDGRVLLARPSDGTGRTPTWYTRDGKPGGILRLGNVIPLEPRLSPHGTRLLFDQQDSERGNRDLWSFDLRQETMLRLTSNGANDLEGVWSHDERQIAFASDRSGRPEMGFFRKDSSVADRESPLALKPPPGSFDLTDWSADDQWLLLASHEAPPLGIWLLPAAGGVPVLFHRSRFFDADPRFSPDGKWIAFSSDAPGRREVFVKPFRGAQETGPAVQVSNNNADYPVWSKDGRELYFATPSFTLYAVTVKSLEAGIPAPVELFTACPDATPAYGALNGYQYDVAPDGRFLVMCRSRENNFIATVNGPLISKPR